MTPAPFIVHWIDEQGQPRRAEHDELHEAEALFDWLRFSERRGVRLEYVEGEK